MPFSSKYADKDLAQFKALALNFNQSVIDGDQGAFKTSLSEWRDAIRSALLPSEPWYIGNNRVLAEIHSKAGDIPHWGQVGNFIITVNQIAFRVYYQPPFNHCEYAEFAFFATNITRPFISKTGCRCEYLMQFPEGCNVSDVARMIIEQRLNDTGLVPLSRDAKRRIVNNTPPWVHEQLTSNLDAGAIFEQCAEQADLFSAAG